MTNPNSVAEEGELPQIFDDPTDEREVEKEIVDAAMRDVDVKIEEDPIYKALSTPELAEVAVNSAILYADDEEYPGEFDAGFVIDTIVRGVDRVYDRMFVHWLTHE